MKLTNKAIEKLEVRPVKYEVRDDDSRLVLRVGSGGTKTFYVYWKKDGQLTKHKIGLFGDIDLGQARKEASDLAARLTLGVVKEPKKAGCEFTLGRFVDEVYAPRAMVTMKQPKATLGIIRAEFKEWWSMKLDKITAKDVMGWQEKRLAQGIKPSTLNRSKTALMAVINSAVRAGVIERNEASAAKKLRVEQDHVIRWLKEDEKAKFLEALKTEREWFSTFCRVMMNTGCRPIELVTMEWKSIDLDRGELRITAGYSKTGKSRVIPLNDEAKRVLEEWKEGAKDSDALLFPRWRCPTGEINPLEGRRMNPYFKQQMDKYNSEPGKIINQKALTILWNDLMYKSGIEGLRMYDLRHNFASQLVMRGIDLYTVGQLLGHSDVKMTMRYAHLSPDHMRNVVNLL